MKKFDMEKFEARANYDIRWVFTDIANNFKHDPHFEYYWMNYRDEEEVRLKYFS